MNGKGALNALIGMRMAIGLASWFTPRVAGKLFGLDAEANPQSPYLARLFGARDLALAVGALGSEGEARRQWLVLGVACDLADAAAGVAGGRRRYLPTLTAVLVSVTALIAAALGAKSISDQ